MLLSFAPPKEPRKAEPDELGAAKVTKEKVAGKANRDCFSPFAQGHFPLQKTATVRTFWLRRAHPDFIGIRFRFAPHRAGGRKMNFL